MAEWNPAYPPLSSLPLSGGAEIENEVKFVMKPVRPLLEALSSLGEGVVLRQGYLDGHARLRQFSAPDGSVKYVFSYKIRIDASDSASPNWEVNHELTEGEFEMLWRRAAPKLTKIRRSFAFADEHWDIDVLLDADGTPGFVLAEAEMPAGRASPSQIPPIVAEHLLFAVPRGDKRFSSRRLAEPGHAAAMFAALGFKHKTKKGKMRA